MESTSTRKECEDGDGCKLPAAVDCRGCSQAFCIKHLLNHRGRLAEEMNIIIDEHDQFQHVLNQQIANSDSHPLIKQIDEWENESIVKIQQKATELRQELLQLTTVHSDDLSTKLRDLSEKMKEGREHESFVETDLDLWKKYLDYLIANFALPSTFSINRHHEIPLVNDISINFIGTNELFEQVFDNTVQIEENGRVAIHGLLQNYTEICGKNEYMSGCHKIRLCIEQSSDTWMFLGIDSKLNFPCNKSHNSKSAYGWTNNNCIWVDGQHSINTSTPRIEMKMNDIIILIFDCDQRKISMINERTNIKYELSVNIDNCPFPWQLYVNFYEPNSRVRILLTSS
jgi:hypothetical protein